MILELQGEIFEFGQKEILENLKGFVDEHPEHPETCL